MFGKPKQNAYVVNNAKNKSNKPGEQNGIGRNQKLPSQIPQPSYSRKFVPSTSSDLNNNNYNNKNSFSKERKPYGNVENDTRRVTKGSAFFPPAPKQVHQSLSSFPPRSAEFGRNANSTFDQQQLLEENTEASALIPRSGFRKIPPLPKKKTGNTITLGKTQQKPKLRAPSPSAFEFLIKNQFSSMTEKQSMLTEQLKDMIERANRDQIRPHRNTYQTLQNAVVSQIFKYCHLLAVNDATAFRALELFDKFVVRFNDEIYHKIKVMEATERETVRERVIAQGPLRICTCIFLASKLHGDTKTPNVTTKKIHSLLLQYGMNFTGKAIALSESRVLASLNFRMHWVTPFDLVDQMICVTCVVDKGIMAKIYHHAILLLEFFYLTHHEIYRKLYASKGPHPQDRPGVGSKSSSIKAKESRKAFRNTVELNAPLRSAAIVVSAVFLIHRQTYEKVAKDLSSLINISEQDIFDLFLIILDHVIL